MFQREETRTLLQHLAAKTDYNILYSGNLHYSEYKREMARSAVVPSPFGWDEICFRDFECFLAGSMLLKPDMSHLESWPHYYEPGVTYQPYAWDFSDFNDKLLALLDQTDLCHRIAQTGQNRYLETVSRSSVDKFAQHFSEIIQKALTTSTDHA